ncbi:MAG: IS66 family transposase [Deltaproteobacteria bacterium]|nr:IS66 family transposase [Deltaproteobacteria bacterium]
MENGLREKDEELAAQALELAKRDAMLEAVKTGAEELAQQLEFLKLKASGPASQRYVPDEQDMLPFPGDVTPPPRAPEPEPDESNEEDASEKKKRRREGKSPKRRNREAFAHMPSRPVRCKATDDATCASCGGLLGVIGQAVSFRIDWVPGHFIVDDLVRDKCACPDCPEQGVLTVPGPYALDRALCGNGLLARVLVDKFADHLPLNRQARRMGREGFEVGSNTLAGWVKQSAGLLGVVAKVVRAELLDGDFLQGDDTGCPVQDGGDGALRKGRLWAFTNQDQVFYAFTPTKQGIYPAELLEDFAGDLLLVDGGSEFNKVVREQDLDRAGCWSHLRTYFFHARHHNPVESALALATIRDLFLLERSLRGRPPDEVHARRQAEAVPLIDGFFEWVKALSTRVRPKSKLGEAVTYARNQETAMRLHLDHGELPMHNQPVRADASPGRCRSKELAVRPVRGRCRSGGGHLHAGRKLHAAGHRSPRVPRRCAREVARSSEQPRERAHATRVETRHRTSHGECGLTITVPRVDTLLRRGGCKPVA